jgi:ribosome maturation protein SDO1
MGIGKPISMDQERVNFNLARIKKGGKKFEIVVDPDKAIAHKKGEKTDIREVLRGEKIFSDAKKGVFSLDSDLKAVFNTNDALKVAEAILKDGEIQLTTEYRDKLREDKRKKILYLIHRNAADPKTNLPHPMTRIEAAFEQSKCKIDEMKSAEEQVSLVVKALRAIIPIKIEQVTLRVDVPPQNAHQAYGLVKRYGAIKQENWATDGSLIVKVELAAGLQEELMESLNHMTHGGVDIKILGEAK